MHTSCDDVGLSPKARAFFLVCGMSAISDHIVSAIAEAKPAAGVHGFTAKGSGVVRRDGERIDDPF